MSLATHSLRVTPPGGVATVQTLSEWGVTSAILNKGVGGKDELNLTFARNFTQSGVISPWSVVELLDPEGERRFSGTAMRPRQTAEAGRRTHTVKVLGPHFRLQCKTHLQTWQFAVDPNDEESAQAPSDISSVILYRGTGEDRVSLEEQCQEILDQAISAGAPVLYDFDHFPSVYLTEQKDRLANAWELLSNQVAIVPHVTMFWDYRYVAVGQEVPCLRFATGANGTVSSIWGSRTIGPSILEHCEIIPRDDLLLKEVKVAFVRTTAVEAGGRRVRVRSIQIQTSTAGPTRDAFYSPVTQVIEIPLRPPVLDGGTISVPGEEVPPGHLAQTLHGAFLDLWHEFKLTVPGQTVDWSWEIGQGLTVTGMHADIGGSRAMVVAISHDIGRGRTVVTAGPPGRLTQMGLGAIAKPFKSANGSFDAADDPDDAVEPDDSPESTDHVDAWMDAAGEPKYYRFRATEIDPPEEE